jgi:hypothetical protein
MDFLTSLTEIITNCFDKTKHELLAPLAAGCVFTDGRHMLAGYQPNKKDPRISGIGGTALPGEEATTTAIRETLEELFHIQADSTTIQDIQMYLIPQDIIHSGSYTIVKYTFDDLHCILDILKTRKVQSPLYDTIPKNIMELIFNRRIAPEAEVSHLTILPLVNHTGDNFVGKELVSDIQLLLHS